MPLKVNGVLIENRFAPVGVENYDNLEKADDGDTRKRAFCNHEYIKANPLIPNNLSISFLLILEQSMTGYIH